MQQAEHPNLRAFNSPPEKDVHIGLLGHERLEAKDEAKIRECLCAAFKYLAEHCEPAPGERRLFLHFKNAPGAVTIGREEFTKWFKTTGRHGQLRDLPVKTDLPSHFRRECDLVIALWDGIWRNEESGPCNTSSIVESLRSPESARDGHARCQMVLSLACATCSNPHPATEKFSWTTIPLGIVAASRVMRARLRWQACRAVLLGVLALTVVATGALGLMLKPGESYHWADAIPSGIAHLALDGFDPVGNPDPIKPDSAVALTDGQADEGHAGPVIGPSKISSGNHELSAFLIRLSRWLAIAFFILAAGAVLNTAFHFVDRIRLWWTARRNHELICGLGWHGRALLEYRKKGDPPAIAIDKDPPQAVIDLCRRFGIPLIAEDATNPLAIAKSGIANTDRAFVSAGSDEDNLRITHTIATLVRKSAGSGPARPDNNQLICRVGLKSRASFDAINAALPANENPHLDLRLFHTEAVTAREFLRENHPDRFTASPHTPGARLILIGDGVMAEEMLRQALLQCIYEPGKELRIDVVGDDCVATRGRFCETYRAYEPMQVPDKTTDPANCTAIPREEVWSYGTTSGDEVLPAIHFHSTCRHARGLEGWLDDTLRAQSGQHPWVTSVLVLHDDFARSAATAAAAAPILEHYRNGGTNDSKQDIALWFYFDSPDDAIREDLERSLDLRHSDLPIRAFSDFMGHCARSAAAGDELDDAARRVNAYYCARDNGGEALKQALLDKTYQREKWRALPEIQKNSNRLAAAHNWIKIRMRCRLAAAGKFSDEIRDILARAEHRRWCAEYLLNGYQPLTPRIPCAEKNFSPTPVEQQEIAAWFGDESAPKKLKKEYLSMKRHACLVPYDDLPLVLGRERGKTEQTKDIVTAENLDAILFGVSPGNRSESRTQSVS